MKILITGTPGVGKTTLSQSISQETGVEHIEITNFIKKNKLYEKYDEVFDTLIFDEDHVIENLNSYVEKKDSFIIDTHTPVVACDIEFDIIFHLVCSTSVIYDRLNNRGYSKNKIDENISSEIFNVIGEELEELFDVPVYKVNCSDLPVEDVDFSKDEAIRLAVEKLKSEKRV